jgi:hypothetical protein
MKMSDTNNNTVDKGPVYDQFTLAGQVDCVTSARLMKILRNVRKHVSIGEGILAGACGERTFNPEWSQFINKLVEFGFIKLEPTGHGIARRVSLTPVGEEFMQFHIGSKVVEPTTGVANGTLNA